jgi:hypothetical protein
MRCAEKLQTFQALLATKQRTAKTVQVVAREQLGPQLGKKAMMEQGFTQGSVT